jgi:hypothetical protein
MSGAASRAAWPSMPEKEHSEAFSIPLRGPSGRPRMWTMTSVSAGHHRCVEVRGFERWLPSCEICTGILHMEVPAVEGRGVL